MRLGFQIYTLTMLCCLVFGDTTNAQDAQAIYKKQIEDRYNSGELIDIVGLLDYKVVFKKDEHPWLERDFADWFLEDNLSVLLAHEKYGERLVLAVHARECPDSIPRMPLLQRYAREYAETHDKKVTFAALESHDTILNQGIRERFEVIKASGTPTFIVIKKKKVVGTIVAQVYYEDKLSKLSESDIGKLFRWESKNPTHPDYYKKFTEILDELLED